MHLQAVSDSDNPSSGTRQPGLPRPLATLLFMLAAAAPGSSSACWTEAASRYGVAVELLYAMAQVESGFNAGALNRSHRQRTGSYDIGLMQINSSHLPALAKHGIDASSLNDPCTNLMVGAWLLADSFSRHGITWNAVGAYNASCSQLRGPACAEARNRYAWRVYRAMAGRAPQTPPLSAPGVAP